MNVAMTMRMRPDGMVQVQQPDGSWKDLGILPSPQESQGGVKVSGLLQPGEQYILTTQTVCPFQPEGVVKVE